MRFHQLHDWFNSDVAQGILQDNAASIQLLMDSQKFYAGAAELVPHFDLSDIPRLPFPKTAVEFEVIEDQLAPRTIIMLAEEGPNDFWGVVCYSKLNGLGTWLPLGRASGQRGAPSVDVNVPSRVLDVLFGRRDATAVAKVRESVQAQVHLLCRFLSVLNCRNVGTQAIPPSAALNKKRTTAGKPPIYEYKVLILKASGARLSGDGSHASPRVHLRRGHLKRRKTGTFWWQPHVVGDRERGVVVKDYDASKLQNLEAA